MSGDKLFLFGPPHLVRNGAVVEIRRRKALALLAYLAATGHGHSRSALASLFWPEMEEGRSRTNLRRVLSDLNKSLGDSWADTSEDQIALQPDAAIVVDVAEYRAHVAAGREHDHAPGEYCDLCLNDLRSAVEFYRDDFLAGFTLPDCPEFDEWQFFESEELRQSLVSALSLLVDGHRKRGELDIAISYARRLVTFEPWHEEAHRTLMQIYHESGRQEAALRQFQELRRFLAEELDAPPSVETTRLYDELAARRIVPAAATGGDTSRRADDTTRILAAGPKHNLPAATSSFVGREADLANLARLLDEDEARLITIHAPGGMGKTRLAVEFARTQLPVFANGVWFVELASVHTRQHIITAVIRALALEFHSGGDVFDQLVQCIRDRYMLLILDNFEHLVFENSLVAELLRAAPGLRIIVTSQQRLNLSAETVYAIGGLDIATDQGKEADTQAAAIELFIQSARRIRPEMELTERDLDQIAQICQAVEGMPLAIVLAASWVDVLSLAEIGTEIIRGLDFLSAELGDLPPRQWSIRAVMDAAWHRLPEAEQLAYMKMSVFRGGFTREAAQTVSHAGMAILRSLVNGSLLDRDNAGRYVVHELPRKYALERLVSSGQYRATARSHAHYFLDLATEGNKALIGPDQNVWLERLEAEQANFRCAFEWALSGADVELGAHLAGALALFWRRRAHYSEATTIGEQALGLLGETSSEARLALHLMLGSIYEPLAQYDASTHHFENGLHMAQAAEDATAAAYALHGLSRMAWRQGRYELAESYARESLRLAEAAGDDRGLARALYQLGLVASHQGQLATAREFYVRSLAANEAICNQIGITNTLVELGWVATSQGRYEEANGYLARSLELSETSGFRMDIAASLNTLGWASEAQGDDARALHYYERALSIYEAIGLRTGLANTLANIAFVRIRQGDMDAADHDLQLALRIAEENGDFPVLLEILIGFARHHLQTDNVRESIRLAAFVHGQPALNTEVRRTRLAPLLADLERILSPDEFATEMARSEELDISGITDQLLSAG